MVLSKVPLKFMVTLRLKAVISPVALSMVMQKFMQGQFQGPPPVMGTLRYFPSAINIYTSKRGSILLGHPVVVLPNGGEAVTANGLTGTEQIVLLQEHSVFPQQYPVTQLSEAERSMEETSVELFPSVKTILVVMLESQMA